MNSHEISRRRFLEAALGAAGAAVLATSALPSFARAQESEEAPYPVPTETVAAPEAEPVLLYERFGLHDAPYVGGTPPSRVPEAIEDFKTLGVKWLKTLNPNETLLKASKDAGITVISRATLPFNRFNKPQLQEMVDRVKKYYPSPIIQPYNEVNLENETGVSPILLPEDHINRDFIPAAELISESTNFQGTTLLAPIAQNAVVAGISEEEYLARMLEELKAQKGLDWIRENNIGLGMNAYIFAPLEDPWERIRDRAKMTKEILGIDLPIYLLEGGLQQEGDHRVFDEATVAAETKRLLTTPIPPDIAPLVQSYCFWLYVSDAYWEEDLFHMPADFEKCAWKKKDHAASVFATVKDLAGEVAEAKMLP